MAKTLQFLASFVLILLTLITAVQSHSFSRTLSPETLGLKKEKLTHLHFYFHDIITSKNPTAVPIIKGVANSSVAFGALWMVDDALTIEPDINSKLVGRAQGMSGLASQTEIESAVVFNLVFLKGKYNGSTLSLLGRNSISAPGVKEMPIVGGSKFFRFARGYALAKTLTIDLKTNNSIVEYNVYVLHY